VLTAATAVVVILASWSAEAKNDKKKLRRGAPREIAGEYIVTLEVPEAATHEDIHARRRPAKTQKVGATTS
jgi:hypothetical protein